MVELEKASIPTVTILSDGFQNDAIASAKAFGMADITFTVVPKVYNNISVEETISQTTPAVDEIMRLLTTPKNGYQMESAALRGKDDATESFEGTDQFGALEKFNEAFLDNDWGDGFPLIPPIGVCLRSLSWQWVCRWVCLRSDTSWGDADMPLGPMGREQMWMLRPTLDEKLPLDHPARFVAEFVDALDREDWGELEEEIDGEALGAAAYHARALLSVWLYGFMTGVRSCRKLEAACRDQIPYLWLTGWQHPDHNTLWRFYRGHRQAMRKLFERTVRTAVTMKLVDLAVQAVDGTKVVANASLNRSYDAEGLRGLLERLESAITDLEAQNEAGEDASAIHLPRELADKEFLREQVRQAMDDLESKERHKRINLTDPDARLMKGRQGIVAGYNAQAMVSPTETDGGATGMLVTAVDVVDAANDNALLVPMLEQA